MTQGESRARSALQIFLEFQRPSLIGKLDHRIHLPRAMLLRMRATPGVVSRETCPEVGGHAGVEARRILKVLEDVHDALRCCHALEKSKWNAPSENAEFPRRIAIGVLRAGRNRHGGDDRVRQILRSD